MAETTIQVKANVRLAVAWVRLMGLASRVIGAERAFRLASDISPRLIIVRFGRGRWHWLRP